MKILFINGNPYKPAVPPIGLEYVCEAAQDAGHEAVIYDFSHESPAGLERSVRAYRPDVIGITLRNIDTGHLFNNISYIPELKALIAGIRAYFGGPIVLGGAGFSLLPSGIMREVEADYGIIGEGEEYFPRLLENLGDPARVPNLVIRDKETGKIVCTPREMGRPLRLKLKRGTINHPKYYELFSRHPTHSLANIQTKRGCNKNCTYCAEPDVIGRTIIKREPEEIIDEIRRFIGKGIVDKFFFVDSEFNVCPDHAAAVCEALLKHDLRIGWTCYLTPENTGKDLVSLMKRAGCTSMVWSMESASETVLKGLGKAYAPSDVMRIAGICGEMDQPYIILLMFGGPGESVATVNETWRNVRKAKKAFFGIITGVRIYPSTPLARQALKDGVISREEDLLFPVFHRKEYTRDVIFPAVEKRFGSMKDCVLLGPEKKTKFD